MSTEIVASKALVLENAAEHGDTPFLEFYDEVVTYEDLHQRTDAVASSLRFGLSGAAPIPPEQLEECERRFHVPILEAYGATENSRAAVRGYAGTFSSREGPGCGCDDQLSDNRWGRGRLDGNGER